MCVFRKVFLLSKLIYQKQIVRTMSGFYWSKIRGKVKVSNHIAPKTNQINICKRLGVDKQIYNEENLSKVKKQCR